MKIYLFFFWSFFKIFPEKKKLRKSYFERALHEAVIFNMFVSYVCFYFHPLLFFFLFSFFTALRCTSDTFGTTSALTCASQD